MQLFRQTRRPVATLLAQFYGQHIEAQAYAMSVASVGRYCSPTFARSSQQCTLTTLSRRGLLGFQGYRQLQMVQQRRLSEGLYMNGAIRQHIRNALDRSHQVARDTWQYGEVYLQHSAKFCWDALNSCYNLPSWATVSLTGIHRGWSIPWTKLPSRDWFLRPSFDARVAIINALYTVGGNFHRAIPILLANLLRRDSYLARCFTETGPPEDSMTVFEKSSAVHRSLLEVLVDALFSVLRLAHLMLIFTPLLITSPLALLYAIQRHRWLHLLRGALQYCGPAFIKWGQWASTRHDLFPPDFCAELALLQTEAPCHSYQYTQKVIRNAFGSSIEELFDEFNPQPIASGSIGQIYCAVLSDRGQQYTGVKAGRRVAVKVRHPGVTEAIERDFVLMMMAARTAALLPVLRELRLEDSLRQFAAPLREQVDFTLEALHLWQFNYNFRNDKKVHFPFPLYPLVAPEVLVETFEEGSLVSNYVKLGQAWEYSSDLAELGASTMLHMMLVDNLIHADLHPGNILVRLEPPSHPVGRVAYTLASKWQGKPVSEWMEPHVVLLDVGMANRLNRMDQENMMGLFKGLSKLDGRQIGEWTLKFSADEQNCPNPEAFIADVEVYFNNLKRASSWEEAGYSHGADAMQAALEFVRKHKVSLPGHICAVLVTTLVLEGWSSRLDPDHGVMETINRIVEKDDRSWKSYWKKTWQRTSPSSTDLIMI